MNQEPLYTAKQAGLEDPTRGRLGRRMIIAASIFAITIAMALVVRYTAGANDELRRSPGSGRGSSAHSLQDGRRGVPHKLATALASRAQGGSHTVARADDHGHHEEDEGEGEEGEEHEEGD